LVAYFMLFCTTASLCSSTALEFLLMAALPRITTARAAAIVHRCSCSVAMMISKEPCYESTKNWSDSGSVVASKRTSSSYM
jgi:hypothetical protein